MANGYIGINPATITGGSVNLQDIFKQFQVSEEEARRISEQRYQDILSLYENLGQAGRARIQRETGQAQATATQSLISRGLGGTTVTEAARRGIGRESELAMQQLEESVALQRAGVMERRVDEGPDLSLYANLLAAMAAGGGGGATFTGMGPMAQAGLTATGAPSKYFGQQAAGGYDVRPATEKYGTGYTTPSGGALAGGVGGGVTPTPAPTTGGGAVYMGEKGTVLAGGQPAAQGEQTVLVENRQTKERKIMNYSAYRRLAPGHNWRVIQ